MARPQLLIPTDVEIRILNAFWSNPGPQSINTIHNVINHDTKSAYSSVATITRIMIEKDLIKIVDQKRPQKFEPTVNRERVVKMILDHYVDKLGFMSVAGMVSAYKPK